MRLGRCGAAFVTGLLWALQGCGLNASGVCGVGCDATDAHREDARKVVPMRDDAAARADSARERDARTTDVHGGDAGVSEAASETSTLDATPDVRDATSPPAGLTVSGTITGLTGAGLVISNRAQSLMPIAGDTAFTFAPQPPDSAYDVSVTENPSSQTCAVLSLGHGTVVDTSITGVVIGCVADTHCSPSCGLGSACASDSDCASRSCGDTRVCTVADCAPTCDQGEACGEGADCSSGNCKASQCAPPACANSCPNGSSCEDDVDCSSKNCEAQICVAPGCAPTCDQGEACSEAFDCSSDVCTGGQCASPPCHGHCSLGTPCGDSSDCASGECDDEVCVAPGCAPDCDRGDMCGEPSDCTSQKCVNGQCG